MEEQTTVVQELTTQTVVTSETIQTEPVTTTGITVSSGDTTIPVMYDNPVHDIMLYMGVDLDYTPKSDYECFTMACRLISGLFLLVFFLIYLFKVISSFFGGSK